MSDLTRFFDYARAFEVAVLADEWSSLERYFTPDAEHRVEGPAPFACDDRGRGAVVSGLRASVSRIERRCDVRIPEVIAGPIVRPDGIWMRFGVGLRRAGLPDLWFEGEHRTVYRDGRIARIDERMDPPSVARAAGWFAEHAARLHPEGTRTVPTDPSHLSALGRALRRTLVRLYASAKSHQDVAAAMAVCHEDFELESIGFGLAARDRKESERQLEVFFRIFPDYSVELEGMAENEEAVGSWGRARLRFGGEMFGIEPTQRRADLPVACVFHFDGGLLRRERFYFDLATLCEQIGAPVEEVSAALRRLRAGSA
jgi:ketosteroid isomerase-like protein